MRQVERPAQTSRLQRRRDLRSEFSPGLLTTALTIGAVLLLVSVTFVADWLRTPGLELSASGDLFSPNGDQSYDALSLRFRLSEAARVSAVVLAQGGSVARTLLAEQELPAGEHFLAWDGLTDFGALAPDGQYRLQVTARGPLRETVQSAAAVIDTQPPALQLVNLNNGQRVGAASLAVQGISEAGTVVWLDGDPQPLVVDGQGRFTFQRSLAEGENQFSLRAVDAAGNTTRLARQVFLVTRPPDLVISNPLENQWTNQAVLTVIGKAPPNTALTINGQPVAVSPQGDFNHQLLLDEGANQLTFIVTDDVGNAATLTRSVSLKTRPPVVELSLAEGTIVGDGGLLLSGRTDPGTTILVNGRVAAVGQLGDFQTALNLNSGDNFINIEARDQAGNLTTLVRRVRLQPGAAADPLTDLSRNLGSLPSLTLPVILLISVVLAFVLLRQGRVDLALSVEQNRFTPGAPGEGKALELTLDLSKTARVTLEVLDQSGHPQTTLLRNRRRVGATHVFTWDGYDDAGRPLPPGVYTIQAQAGTPPVQVSSSVQVTIDEDIYVHRAYTRRRSVRQVGGTDGEG